MSITKLGNLTAKIGEYQKNGETKGQYAKCGALFQRDDGSFTVKLDTIPLNFNGWLSVYSDEPTRTHTDSENVQQQGGAREDNGFEDSLPAALTSSNTEEPPF